MNLTLRYLTALLVATLLLGCGGSSTPIANKESLDKQAQAKIQALKEIADALSKGPASLEVQGAIENWRSMPFDPQAHPKETEELVQIYKSRIQGKAKGEVAQELGSFFAPILGGKKS